MRFLETKANSSFSCNVKYAFQAVVISGSLLTDRTFSIVKDGQFFFYFSPPVLSSILSRQEVFLCGSLLSSQQFRIFVLSFPFPDLLP
jgi:hypothetical protein